MPLPTAAVIGKTLLAGWQGQLSRGPQHAEVISCTIATTSAAILAGEPVIINDDGTVSSVSTGALTAANFFGLAVANIQNSYSGYPFTGTALPGQTFQPGSVVGILRKGYIFVTCENTSGLVVHGQVYNRDTLNGAFPTEGVGAWRASADGSNTLAVPNARFVGPAVDANGNIEIQIQAVN